MKNDKIVSSSRRDDNSLYILTKKFLELLKKSPEMHISMKEAADILNVGKRRIYDVTNVLDGLGMVSKWSVNSVKWTGQNIEEYVSSSEEILEGIEILEKGQEQYMNEEMERMNEELNILSQDESNLKYAYVTYEDLLRLGIFRNKMVFALKAPSETTVEYPRYIKGLFKLRIMTENGQISLFYITKNE